MKTNFLPDELVDTDPLEFSCRADELGVPIAPGESFEAFRERLKRSEAELPKHLPADLPEVRASVREHAGRITAALYGFAAEWLPAYYSTAETGRFSAGVSLISGDGPALVCLSGAFRDKDRHLGYDAAETLAHESVHAARAAFPENSVYDEYFACQVHRSKFRRNVGNLFRRWYIPVLFFLGLNPWLFILPLAIVLRECQLRRRLNRAGEKLAALGLRPEPVLLRLSDAEIAELARGSVPAALADETSLRRRLFFRRFTRK